MKPELNIHRRYVHADRGTVHIIPVPDRGSTGPLLDGRGRKQSHEPAQRSSSGRSRTAKAGSLCAAAPRPGPARRAFHHRARRLHHQGEPQLRQYFGSLGKGNGDPTLDTYGDDVIPNQRKLAREFVLLDNFYANGGNSADGHQWVTQAAETDYTYWPGYNGRSYPKNGDDPLAFAGSGFLWDHLSAHHKTFADFGEFVGELDEKNNNVRVKLLDEYKRGGDFVGAFETKAPIAPLNQVSDCRLSRLCAERARRSARTYLSASS